MDASNARLVSLVVKDTFKIVPSQHCRCLDAMLEYDQMFLVCKKNWFYCNIVFVLFQFGFLKEKFTQK